MHRRNSLADSRAGLTRIGHSYKPAGAPVARPLPRLCFFDLLAAPALRSRIRRHFSLWHAPCLLGIVSRSSPPVTRERKTGLLPRNRTCRCGRRISGDGLPRRPRRSPPAARVVRTPFQPLSRLLPRFLSSATRLPRRVVSFSSIAGKPLGGCHAHGFAWACVGPTCQHEHAHAKPWAWHPDFSAYGQAPGANNPMHGRGRDAL
jgi:hypothetical protein